MESPFDPTELAEAVAIVEVAYVRETRSWKKQREGGTDINGQY